MTTKKAAPRLQTHFETEVIPELMKRFSFSNRYQVPHLVKIVINQGLNDARENVKVVDMASAELAAITGQKAQVRRAKKSISNFKLREGMPIGVRVTLRKQRMFEFLDRLINIAIPRIRDFRGLETNAFDGRGNYNLGLNEQHIFPEINLEKSDKARGMNITFVIRNADDAQARQMLELLGMPFRKAKPAAAGSRQ